MKKGWKPRVKPLHFGCLYIRDVISLNTYACLHTRLGSWRVRAVFCSPLCSWGLVRSPPQKSCFINVCWQSRSHQRQTFTSAALPLPSTYLFSSLNVVGKPRVATPHPKPCLRPGEAALRWPKLQVTTGGFISYPEQHLYFLSFCKFKTHLFYQSLTDLNVIYP